MRDPQVKVKELKAKYEKVFSSSDGQEVLKDIMLSGGCFRASFTELDGGKQELAFHINSMAQPEPEQPKVQGQAIV